jgi:predicted Rossmann-fold nucleotide-binding protein
MEAVCRGAVEQGGASLGVLLPGGGEPNRFLTGRIVAEDLADRLRRLRDLPEAWIFLPRGLGTMLELLFVAESIVKGQARPRPIVLLGDFWTAILERAIGEASSEEGRRALRSSASAAATASEAVAAALPG